MIGRRHLCLGLLDFRLFCFRLFGNRFFGLWFFGLGLFGLRRFRYFCFSHRLLAFLRLFGFYWLGGYFGFRLSRLFGRHRLRLNRLFGFRLFGLFRRWNDPFCFGDGVDKRSLVDGWFRRAGVQPQGCHNGFGHLRSTVLYRTFLGVAHGGFAQFVAQHYQAFKEQPCVGRSLFQVFQAQLTFL